MGAANLDVEEAHGGGDGRRGGVGAINTCAPTNRESLHVVILWGLKQQECDSRKDLLLFQLRTL